MHFDHSQSFVQLFCSHVQQLCALNTVRYLADRKVIKVTWFRKMLTHMPNLSAANASVTKNMQGYFKCLFASNKTGIVYQPTSIDVHLNDSALLTAMTIFLAGFGSNRVILQLL